MYFTFYYSNGWMCLIEPPEQVTVYSGFLIIKSLFLRSYIWTTTLQTAMAKVYVFALL